MTHVARPFSSRLHSDSTTWTRANRLSFAATRVYGASTVLVRATMSEIASP